MIYVGGKGLFSYPSNLGLWAQKTRLKFGLTGADFLEENATERPR